jgi:hypothetical protein
MEDVHRALAVEHPDGEAVAGLRVEDRDGHATVVLVPQHPDVDAITRAAVQLAGRVEDLGGHGGRSPDGWGTLR